MQLFGLSNWLEEIVKALLYAPPFTCSQAHLNFSKGCAVTVGSRKHHHCLHKVCMRQHRSVWSLVVQRGRRPLTNYLAIVQLCACECTVVSI